MLSLYQKLVPEEFSGDKARPVRKAGNPTALFKPIVQTMWDPQHLTIVCIGFHGLLQGYLHSFGFI
jgi:hypothetical protein